MSTQGTTHRGDVTTRVRGDEREAGVTPDQPDPSATSTSSARPSSHASPDRLGYIVAAAAIGLGLFASVTLTPLHAVYAVYAVYAERWHFGSVTLTLVYAAYAAWGLATLLLAGRVSDYVGRRPIPMGAMGAWWTRPRTHDQPAT